MVRGLAAEDFSVRLACGVRGFATQAYCAWLKQPVELAIHQVGRGRDAPQSLHAGRPRQPLDSGQAHENRHQSLADADTHAQRQLGMNPPRAVGATGSDVDLADQPGQPLPAQGVLERDGPAGVVIRSTQRQPQFAVSGRRG